MKKIILLLLTILAFSCTKEKPYNAEVMYGPQQQKVVYVQDNGNNFYMDYLLYTSLMNSSGSSGVRSYYQSHPTEFRSSTLDRYRSYKPRVKPVIHSKSVEKNKSMFVKTDNYGKNLNSKKQIKTKSYSSWGSSSKPSSYSSSKNSFKSSSFSSRPSSSSRSSFSSSSSSSRSSSRSSRR